MNTHEPENYACPFCNFFDGHPDKYNVPEDIVYQNQSVVAFISPRWWKSNPGHVLVVPKAHFENIYTISDESLTETYKAVKQIAAAIRSTYDCDGTSTRQHNEPAGGQDVWHFHVHVFPRYAGDDLYLNEKNQSFVDKAARAPYAGKLKAYFAKRPS